MMINNARLSNKSIQHKTVIPRFGLTVELFIMRARTAGNSKLYNYVDIFIHSTKTKIKEPS